MNLHSPTPDATLTYRLEQLPGVVQRLLPLMLQHKVVALHGDLGTGKTTFTAALCRLLQTTEQADSPTFSLINQYSYEDADGRQQLIYHSDWYRIGDEEEARMAGIEDMLEQTFSLCLVEWPERAPGLLPEDTLHLYFNLGAQPDSRTITSSHPFFI